MNIFHLLNHHAQLRPYDLALIHSRGSLNYLRLRTLLAVLAERFSMRGFQRGETVAIYLSDPFQHVTVMMALMLMGIRTFSAQPNYDAPPLGLAVDRFLADRDLAFPPTGASVRLDDTWFQLDKGERAFPDHAGFHDESEICRIFSSSGTTGVSKAIGHNSRTLSMQTMIRLSRDALMMSGPTISLMPVATIGGFNSVFYAFWGGYPVVLTTGPVESLRAINLYGIRTMLASPAQLEAIVGMLQGSGARFPSLQRIQVGGSVLPAALAMRARVLLCQNILNSYGATETAGAVTTATGAILHRHPSAAGYILPGAEIQIVDERHQPLPSGQEGVVRIRSPFISQGYIGDPQASQAAFVDGWFIPGDLGVLNEDGLLVITGRLSEIINANGVKVSPHLIDEFLLTLPGVQDAAAFGAQMLGGGEQIWAAVVPDSVFDIQLIDRACRQKLNSRAPVRFVEVARIPRNSMGKIIRHELVKAFSPSKSH